MNEEFKALLHSKNINETIQIVVIGIAVAAVLISIPRCTQKVDMNTDSERAAVKIAAIEAGLVQKVVKRVGSSNTDIVWDLPNEPQE